MAASWYRRRGWRILDRNWRVRDGELDLVCEQRGTVVFCEVKTRSTCRFGSPAEAVTRAKRARIRRLAAQWLATNGSSATRVRFDVACVQGGSVYVIEDAF